MWCFNWVEILCGNVSWLEEHPLKNFLRFPRAIWKMLQNRGGLVGASCTFRGHLALSKRTSLGHKEIGSCIFSEILYGGS